MGANLKLLRVNHELTQQELADLAGVSKASVSGIEAGRTSLGDAIEKIADLLDVPSDILRSDNPKLLAPYMDSNKIVVKEKLKPKANEYKVVESVMPKVTPFKKPVDHKPQPMYATRLNIETKEATDEDGKVFRIPEKKRDVHELNIVQLLACTSGAANKYLSKGWILLNSFARYSDGEFIVLLGSTKMVSAEEFDAIKREARTTPPLTYRPQKFGR